jgi:hypothetical protein
MSQQHQTQCQCSDFTTSGKGKVSRPYLSKKVVTSPSLGFRERKHCKSPQTRPLIAAGQLGQKTGLSTATPVIWWLTPVVARSSELNIYAYCVLLT